MRTYASYLFYIYIFKRYDKTKVSIAGLRQYDKMSYSLADNEAKKNIVLFYI